MKIKPLHLRAYDEPTKRSVPCWLACSVGGALHRYRRGHGFNSRFIFTTAQVVLITLMVTYTFVHKYMISYIHINLCELFRVRVEPGLVLIGNHTARIH